MILYIIYTIYTSLNLWNMSLEIAEKQQGERESYGSNNGKMINIYLKEVGLKPGSPYCMAGQYWTFEQASKILKQKNPLKRTGSANAEFDYIKSKSMPETRELKRGDFITWKSVDSYKGHVARITKKLSNSLVETIEFNTSPDSRVNRDGDGVYKKVRNIKNKIGKLRIRGYYGLTSNNHSLHSSVNNNIIRTDNNTNIIIF